MGPTFGIEEEFVLLDPATLTTVDVAPHAVQELKSTEGGVVAHEFFRSQVEFDSPVCQSAADARETIQAFRDGLSRWAHETGVIAAGTGTPYRARAGAGLSAGERYARIAEEIAGITPEHQINGLHVHVGFDDPEARVRSLNGLRPWLPTLLALSANSPFWTGHDTGFDSWRAIHSRRWTTFGIPPPFHDAADYASTVSALIGVGATLDGGTINWNVRLSSRYPTVEIRVCDAQLDPGSVIALALLVRALAAAGARSEPCSRAAAPDGALRDAALWHAARFGLTGQLVNEEGRLVPAGHAVDSMLTHAAPLLKEFGDLETVVGAVALMARRGNGASAQREALQLGVSGLAELYRRCLSADDMSS